MSPTAVVYGIGYSCEEALPFFQYHVYGNGREKDGFSQRAGGLCSDGLLVHLACSCIFRIKYFPRVTICETDAVGISSPRSLHFCNKFFLSTFDPPRPRAHPPKETLY